MKEFLKRKLGAGRKDEFQDLGFGTKAGTESRRLINQNGTFNVKHKGLGLLASFDFYHYLITISWVKFGFIVISSFLITNLIFGLLYFFLGVEHLTGVIHSTLMHDFSEAFFFSAQTLTTVGYGRIAPTSFSTSFVAAVESLLGLLGFALATGLLYGRFSRPVFKLLYSEKALVAPYRGIKGLMFRVANKRKNTLIEAEAQFVMTILDDEKKQRRFIPLELERKKISFLSLSWTIVHPITEDSPMYGLTAEELAELDAEFLVLIKAFDDTFSQTVYSRSSYKFFDVAYDKKFTSIIKDQPDGVTELDLGRIHQYEDAL